MAHLNVLALDTIIQLSTKTPELPIRLVSTECRDLYDHATCWNLKYLPYAHELLFALKAGHPDVDKILNTLSSFKTVPLENEKVVVHRAIKLEQGVHLLDAVVCGKITLGFEKIIRWCRYEAFLDVDYLWNIILKHDSVEHAKILHSTFPDIWCLASVVICMTKRKAVKTLEWFCRNIIAKKTEQMGTVLHVVDYTCPKFLLSILDATNCDCVEPPSWYWSLTELTNWMDEVGTNVEIYQRFLKFGNAALLQEVVRGFIKSRSSIKVSVANPFVFSNYIKTVAEDNVSQIYQNSSIPAFISFLDAANNIANFEWKLDENQVAAIQNTIPCLYAFLPKNTLEFNTLDQMRAIYQFLCVFGSYETPECIEKLTAMLLRISPVQQEFTLSPFDLLLNAIPTCACLAAFKCVVDVIATNLQSAETCNNLLQSGVTNHELTQVDISTAWRRFVQNCPPEMRQSFVNSVKTTKSNVYDMLKQYIKSCLDKYFYEVRLHLYTTRTEKEYGLGCKSSQFRPSEHVLRQYEQERITYLCSKFPHCDQALQKHKNKNWWNIDTRFDVPVAEKQVYTDILYASYVCDLSLLDYFTDYHIPVYLRRYLIRDRTLPNITDGVRILLRSSDVYNLRAHSFDELLHTLKSMFRRCQGCTQPLSVEVLKHICHCRRADDEKRKLYELACAYDELHPYTLQAAIALRDVRIFSSGDDSASLFNNRKRSFDTSWGSAFRHYFGDIPTTGPSDLQHQILEIILLSARTDLIQYAMEVLFNTTMRVALRDKNLFEALVAHAPFDRTKNNDLLSQLFGHFQPNFKLSEGIEVDARLDSIVLPRVSFQYLEPILVKRLKSKKPITSCMNEIIRRRENHQ